MPFVCFFFPALLLLHICTTTEPPSVVVFFSLLPCWLSGLLLFFSFVPSYFSLYVSWSGIYDRLLTAKAKAEWKQELFHSSAATRTYIRGFRIDDFCIPEDPQFYKFKVESVLLGEIMPIFV